MRNTVPLLVVSWLLLCLALIVGGVAVTSAPGEMTWAWPVPGGAGGADAWTGAVGLALGAAAALLLAVAVTVARTGPLARPWAELVLFYGLLFGSVWWVLGPGQPGPWPWAAGALFLLVAARLKAGLRPARPGSRTWRRWVPVDALVVLVPLAVGLSLNGAPAGPSVWVSLLMYPVYAGVQLLVFLAVPADRLRAMGASPRVTSAACAVLFALVHWPNPLVMLLTGLAMSLWAVQYRRGRPLWQLAVIMGLAATVTTQVLPNDWTRGMRVGPRYVRQETCKQLADSYPRHALVALDDYAPRVFPPTLGRPATPSEITDLAATLDRALRPVTAWHFFISAEYGRQADAPRPDQPWTELDPAWQARITDLAERGADLAWPDYIAFLYGEVLGRTAGPSEADGWTRNLNWSRRQRLAEALLDWRLARGTEGPVALSPADLVFVQ